MKNIRIINKQLAFLLAFFFFFQYNLLAQDEPNIIPRNAKGFAEYMEVVQVDSVSKSELYLTALEWMNKTYKSGKSVIQTADNNGGMIIGKANTQTVIYNNMGIMKDGGYFPTLFRFIAKTIDTNMSLTILLTMQVICY
jgi:hypothetical protein